MDRDRAVGDRARTSADRAGRRDAPAAPQPNRRTAAAVLRLQAAAGNRAVARLLARDVVRDPQHKALGIKFTVGVEIRIGLAQKAQQLAAGGIDDAKLRQLRAEALTVDETIDDDERMFMAGLLIRTTRTTSRRPRSRPGRRSRSRGPRSSATPPMSTTSTGRRSIRGSRPSVTPPRTPPASARRWHTRSTPSGTWSNS